LFSVLVLPESWIASLQLPRPGLPHVDAQAAVPGVRDSVQSFPGEGLDVEELALVGLRPAHDDDHGAAGVADGLRADAGAVKSLLDDARLLGVREEALFFLHLPGLPALCGIVQERLDGGVGPVGHVAVDVPEVDHGRKGHPVACVGELLDRDGVLAVCAAHERDLADLRALGGESVRGCLGGDHGRNTPISS